MEEVTTPIQMQRAPKWRRYVIYFFAALGLLFSVGIALLASQGKKNTPIAFDADAAIEGVMSTNYGKYSANKRGWLYVDEQSKLTYVVSVVQQKKINGKEGEELYFVTSGQAIDSNSGNDTFYGVFHLRGNNGELYEYSDPRRSSGANVVKAEHVHFEKLSAEVWGWVVKITDIETGDGAEITNTRNVLLAPRKNQIAVLAEFSGASSVLGGGGCDETERRYSEWRKAQSEKKPAEGEEYEGEDFEPPRCTKLRWTYRTDPVANSTFTPLYITRKAGMEEGVPMPAKTWKVVFDPKSYTYLLPEEVRNAGL